MSRYIYEVLARHRPALLRLPNVVGTGVGPKIVAGERKPGLVIKVFVRRKLAREQLAAESLIPTEIEGIPTDVVSRSPAPPVWRGPRPVPLSAA